MTRTNTQRAALTAIALAAIAVQASADVITDWNTKAGEIVVEAKFGTPPANRTMAIVQTAVLEAVNAAARRQPGRAEAVEAAVAAANRSTMLKLMPAQEASIHAAYTAALAKIAARRIGAGPAA